MEKYKSLAILGLGSRSTLFYLRELNAAFNLRYGGFATFPLKMLNTNFDRINALLPERSEQLDEIIREYFHELSTFGSDFILVPNITLHETLDHLDLDYNLIHPIQTTITEVRQEKYKTIFLFATLYSMRSTYISSQFEAAGIEVLLPDPEDMVFIDEVRKHVFNETETKEILPHFNELISNYSQKNPVVLACTELSVAYSYKDKFAVFDMARIQMNEAIKNTF